ncbi:MAG TPA: sulfurtransferase [Candidatus Limnocylindrales bacterium]|nr:sulfurtransferase [Candidatus Limnocylindrales bacterium]
MPVRPELLASTAWLGDNLQRTAVRIVDVRWRPDGSGRQVYAAGHVPRAAHLDWSTELVDADDAQNAFLLAGPGQVAAAMAAAGVGDGTTAVIYDDTASLYASRVWWTLRAYGFESCRILDGGFEAWTSEGRLVSSAASETAHSTFTPRAQLRVRLTTSDVRALLGNPEVQFVDARAPAEYLGHEGNARRLGHVPGAVNLPVATMTLPGTQRFRPVEDLQKSLLRANVTRSRRLVCYDGSGIAAAKLAFVLTYLGYDDVAVYDGGWAEWGNRLDLPVDR